MSEINNHRTFAWWNLHNFAHHDPARISDPRWPGCAEEYQAKMGRLVAALNELFVDDFPDLLAVCEITRPAARGLLARMPMGYRLLHAPPYPHDDGFQVVIFYREGRNLVPEPPLIPTEEEDLSEGTRPMLPIHLELPEHVVRFVACHWTAFDTEKSREARERLADVLRRDIHAFLDPEAESPIGRQRHVVVLGDLNEEPTARLFETRLLGRRDRESSHTRHWRDTQVRRVRLYNAAWKYLGEQVAFRPDRPLNRGPAGTYFQPPHDWRTFDHVLVTGGLLGQEPPQLDEAFTGVRATPILLDGRGLPVPFRPGNASGVSDHLPIVGRITIAENST